MQNSSRVLQGRYGSGILLERYVNTSKLYCAHTMRFQITSRIRLCYGTYGDGV